LLEHLLGWVPGLAAFRVPSRWLVAFVLLATALVAMAIQRWDEIPGFAHDRGRNALGQGASTGRALLFLVFTIALVMAASSCHPEQGWWPQWLEPRRPPGQETMDTVAHRVRWGLYGLAGLFAAAAIAVRFPSWRRLVARSLVVALAFEAVTFASLHLEERSHRPAQVLDWSDATVAALKARLGRHGRLVTGPRSRQANWGGAHGVLVAGGYEAAIPASTNRYANHFAGRPSDRYAVNLQVKRPSAWLDRIAASHLLRNRSDRRMARRFRRWPVVQRLADGYVLQRNPRARPRIEVPDRVEVVQDRAEAAKRLAKLPRTSTIVSAALAHTPNTKARLQITSESSTEIVLSVDTPAPVVVVLRDVALAGWSVQVDGKPAQAALADTLFRAVSVTTGQHVVIWRYQTPGLYGGGAISLFALLAWLVALWLVARPRKARAAHMDDGRQN
jgi:hypothetical protein